MANWVVRTVKMARRMRKLGYSGRSGVGGINAISPPTTSFSSIRSASSKFATPNRRLLGSGHNKVSGEFPASLPCFCSFAAHLTTLQHLHEEGEEPAPAPEPENSTYLVLVLPRPKNQMGEEDVVEDGEDDEYYHYFHLADFEEIEEEEERKHPKLRRIKKNNIPGVPSYNCVGSSHGWLPFLDPYSSSINFVNPLIHSDHIRKSFRLPPIPFIGSASNLEGGGVPFVQKVALSSPPYEDSYTVAAIHGPHRHLAFYKHKDGTWWKPGGVGDYSDVIYSKKDGFFYAIRNPQPNDKLTDFPIQAWDPFSLQSTLIHPIFREPDSTYKNCLGIGVLDEKRYLVESSPSRGGGGGGDLYLVLKYICKCVFEDDPFCPVSDSDKYYDSDLLTTYKTFFFGAYKLNLDDNGMCWWDEVDDLDGQCFFVGMNHSFSVPDAHLHYPMLRKDCVYYSDDCFDKMHLSSNSGGHDNGFYQIHDAKTGVIYNGDVSNYKPPPIWLDVLSQPA